MTSTLCFILALTAAVGIFDPRAAWAGTCCGLLFYGGLQLFV